MIISREEYGQRKPVIDLSGPDGNAFVLMAYAERWSRQLDIEPGIVAKEMQTGDYEHLLEVFDRYFGSYCILVR
jgi:hypothetical protein